MADQVKQGVHQQEQLLLDWEFPKRPSEPMQQTAGLFATEVTRTTTSPKAPATTPSAAGDQNLVEAQTQDRGPYLVQVLPWDFQSSFPPPLEEAIIAGKLNEDDGAPENLKALHDEHARHALSILSDSDAVFDARRRGVDPSTGRTPRTAKQREHLDALFREEPQRLERAFDALMGVYEEAFGEAASDAFRKAMRAWHAGIEVIAEHPPCPRPLTESVENRVFGIEDDGHPVHPSDDEIAAIVEMTADRLLDAPDEATRNRLVARFAEDFGQPAADQLAHWTDAKTESEQDNALSYDPGHPWHYYADGDGADPLPLDDIPAADPSGFSGSMKLPKDSKKRAVKLKQMLSDQERDLIEDEARYVKLIEKGVDGLSDYDRKIASGGDDELAWASTIALMYTRIRNSRGRVNWLRAQLG